MGELWEDVKGFDGLYSVSNLGRVKSNGRWKRNGCAEFMTAPKIMTPVPDRQGYKTLVLTSASGEKKGVKVHRLVASAFIREPEPEEQVNHIDFNKGNNAVGNLEWVSLKENIRHAVAGFHKPQNGKPLLATAVDGLVAWFPSGVAAADLGFSRTSIGLCLRGNRHTHKGFNWRYA